MTRHSAALSARAPLATQPRVGSQGAGRCPPRERVVQPQMIGARTQCLKADVRRLTSNPCDVAVDSEPHSGVGCYLPTNDARLLITDAPGKGRYARSVVACGCA